MKAIDDQGKVFGVINIIDLAVLIVLVLIGMGFFYYINLPAATSPQLPSHALNLTQPDPQEVCMRISFVPNNLAAVINGQGKKVLLEMQIDESSGINDKKQYPPRVGEEFTIMIGKNTVSGKILSIDGHT